MRSFVLKIRGGRGEYVTRDGKRGTAGTGPLVGDEVAFTVSTMQDQVLIQTGEEYVARRLTPTECERLQGFPDGHTAVEGASDTARYKALGNSMAVPVIAWIGGRIQMVEELMGERMDNTETGTRLMNSRRQAGMTQEELADRLGVSTGTVGNWERGVVGLPFSKACQIADLLGIDLETLAGR